MAKQLLAGGLDARCVVLPSKRCEIMVKFAQVVASESTFMRQRNRPGVGLGHKVLCVVKMDDEGE